MDLTIKFENSHEALNVRVAIIMETKNGFVFSHRKNGGFYFLIGGRAKLGESSIDSVIRETEEETGLKLSSEDFKLISIIENFWTSKENDKNWKVHEINYIFIVPMQERIYDAIDSAEVVEIPKEELSGLDIRPAKIKQLILEEMLGTFTHHVV